MVKGYNREGVVVMKKELKIGALIVAVIGLIIISALLYKNGYVNYLIVTGTLLVVTAIALFNLIDLKKVFIIVS